MKYRATVRTALLVLMGLAAATTLFGQSPTAAIPVKYGRLQVTSGQLSDSSGIPVQLRGMSTMGLQWYGGIVNPDAFTALSKDWGADVVRLAMYIGEDGYATHPELENLVSKGIDLAIERGLYVIVDWHVLTPGNPNDPIYAGAAGFFTEISKRYGKYPNIIYEIMNEPNGSVTWAKDLKPYAQKMVNLIRANDPRNIILIGSSTWSQDVDVAAADPVSGTNLMYTVHFYAGTHGKELRDKIQTALDKGAAVFCSEWGTSQASGTGGPYINNSEDWLAFLNAKKISWVNWSLSNKNETSAAFKGLAQVYTEGKGTVVVQKETPLVPDMASQGGYRVWSVDELSPSGAYARAKIKGIAAPTYTAAIGKWDFEDGLEGWTVADDSPLKPALSVGTAESKSLTFDGTWSATPVPDAWSTAPRLKRADTGIAIGSATAVTMDVYLAAGKTGVKGFEIDPILQYPPSWWNQLSSVKFNYADGVPAGNGLLRYSLRVPFSVSPDTKLSHLVLIVVGNGSGYSGPLYFDDIELVGSTNGDASAAPAAAPDNPGTFAGLPWGFEDGSRQGWTVTDDSPVKVTPLVTTAESKALSFTFGWSVPGPADPWNAAPRLTSSFVNLPGSKFSSLSFDFYVEANKATRGSLQVQPIIQSPQHGYWFQINPVNIDFSKGTPVAGGLLKYSATVPLTSNGNPLKPDAIIRNLVMITIGLGTDYTGAVYYDNLTFK